MAPVVVLAPDITECPNCGLARTKNKRTITFGCGTNMHTTILKGKPHGFAVSRVGPGCDEVKALRRQLRESGRSCRCNHSFDCEAREWG